MIARKPFADAASLLVMVALAGCAAPPTTDTPSAPPVEQREWAVALHGGAGTISRDLADDVKEGYLRGLEAALRAASEALASGATSIDVVESAVRILEDDSHFNAGKGAVFTWEEGHELDAAIMNGDTLACGAITGVRTVKNPITLARAVMERSPHVFFAGSGAEAFADDVGVERVTPDYYFTQERFDSLQRLKERRAAEAATDGQSSVKGTVGVVALDRHGNLAAATSTGGLTGKRWGRIGDAPVIGAGTFADDRSCAVSATGAGEEFIRRAVAHSIAFRVEHLDEPPDAAARLVLSELPPEAGGVVVVDHFGRLALEYTSQGMYRGAADSTGRFEVAIWEDIEGVATGEAKPAE